MRIIHVMCLIPSKWVEWTICISVQPRTSRFKMCFNFKISTWIEQDKSPERISPALGLLFADSAYLLCNSTLMIERYFVLTVWHVWSLDKRSLRLYLYFIYLLLFSLCWLCGYQMDCVADDARQVVLPLFLKFYFRDSNSSSICFFSLWGTLNVVVFNCLVLLLIVSHFRAMCSDPGVIPLPQTKMDFSDIYAGNLMSQLFELCTSSS